MTKVTFTLHLLMGGDIAEVPEDVLGDHWDTYLPVLEQQDSLEGAIVVQAGDQSRLEVVDELWAAVQNLCFLSIVALLDEKRECYLYRFTSSDGHLVMIPLAHLVRLLGENKPVVTESMQALLPQLVDCGLRVLHLFNRLGGRAAEFADHLQPYAERATDALVRHNLR
jgi:hypothetical protein